MHKYLLAAACAVPLFLLGITPSLAQVDVDIDLNPGVGVYGGYDDDDDDDYRRRRRGRLKCWEARRLVRDHGYRVVDTIECEGRVYTFAARRRGRIFEVKVNSRTGAVWR
jgi:hypothetical protein